MTDIPTAQLDEVSRLLGQMEQSIKSMDQYIHDFRHDERNRQQVEQNFQEKVVRQIERLREEIKADRLKDIAEATAQRMIDQEALESLRRELADLKADRNRRDGALGVVKAIWESKALTFLVVLAGGAWAWATGKLHL